jgi:hypothetical protein
MQIIAKAVITFLGLSTFVNLSQNFRTMTSLSQTQDISVLRVILFSLFVITLLIAIVYWLILKNDWLVRKISGSGENLDPESETLWLTASLQMVAILYGLILLSGSITAVLNIFYICPLIEKIFVPQTYQIPRVFPLSQLLSIIYGFLLTILTAYLLCGWPHFIRYQLSTRNIDSKGIQK